MKIKIRNLSYDEVLKKPRLKHKKPRKPSRFLASVVRIVSAPTLKKIKFSYTTERMELVGEEPCLILMNHSSFTDMKLAFGIFYPRRMGIVTSVDAMSGILGKLMRFLGCTPTHKYVSDMSLIKDIKYMLKENKTSVLMYPEACYSPDGPTTVLPDSLGGFIKMLGVPVVMITKSEEENIMEQAIGRKISDYLIKPVNPNQILLTIKKNLNRREIIQEKSTHAYQQEFAKLSMQIGDARTPEDWIEVYKRLVYWELELQQSSSELLPMLEMQKQESNAAFVKYIKKNYEDWVTTEEHPLLSHEIFKTKIFPMLDNGEKVFFVLIDNFRLDQ